MRNLSAAAKMLNELERLLLNPKLLEIKYVADNSTNIKLFGQHQFNEETIEYYNDIRSVICTYDKIINYRKKIYKQYRNNLKNLIDKKIIRLQKTEKKNRSSLYCFQIYIEKNNIRNRLAHFLDKNNISTTVYYTPAHMHDFYKKKINSQNQINCNKLFHNSLSLPFHNELKFKDIKKVSNLVNKFFNDSE
jgi:hypothetical protein